MIQYNKDKQRLELPEVYDASYFSLAEWSLMEMINQMADKLDFIYKTVYMNEATKGYPIED